MLVMADQGPNRRTKSSITPTFAGANGAELARPFVVFASSFATVLSSAVGIRSPGLGRRGGGEEFSLNDV
jgi:hypothetical protein